MSDREHPLLIEYSGITALEEKSPPLWLLHPIREKWNVHTFQRKMTSEDVALLASPTLWLDGAFVWCLIPY